jgi:hypothetical protein
MTKEKIEAMVAKRVFGLFYGDEWSSFIFSIRRVHSIRQFKHIETNREVVSKRVLEVGQQYYFESKKAIFLTGGSYDHCIKYFDVYSEIYFKYGPSVFKNNSRSYLFNRSKSIKEAIKECEDDIFGPYGVRKMHNKNFDDPHFMEYYLDYKCIVYK